MIKNLILGLAVFAAASTHASDKNCGKVVAVSGDEKSYQVVITQPSGSFRVGISPKLLILANSALATGLDACVNEDYFNNPKGVIYMNVMNRNAFGKSPSTTSSCPAGFYFKDNECIPSVDHQN